jgi:hypothetical protein
MTIDEKLEKAREVYEDAKAKGRVNREAEDEIEEQLLKLEERVNPTRRQTEELWRWGVATALGLVTTAAIFSDSDT